MKPIRAKSLLKVVASGVVVVLTVIPALAVAARPARPFEAAAVFPPWWNAARVRAAVEPVGEISAIGRMPTVVTVIGGTDVSDGLRTAGAWFILNPALVGCAIRPGATA